MDDFTLYLYNGYGINQMLSFSFLIWSPCMSRDHYNINYTVCRVSCGNAPYIIQIKNFIF